MALTHLLSQWAAAQDTPLAVHAVTVDHGLRPEASQEAQEVGEYVGAWPNISHFIYRWKGRKPESAIQEKARQARYKLLTGHCKEHDIPVLFLAHHLNDQAETLLFRLSKGTGLDGLTGMKPATPHDSGVTLLRPLLRYAKSDLTDYVRENALSFVEDPTNLNLDQARPRLRSSQEALEKEGLTPDRLSLTAQRLYRARAALDHYADEAYSNSLSGNDTARVVYDLKRFREVPDEISVRLVLRAAKELIPAREYAPRLEKVENLVRDLVEAPAFTKRTLGGLIFERNDKVGKIVITIEK